MKNITTNRTNQDEETAFALWKEKLPWFPINKTKEIDDLLSQVRNEVDEYKMFLSVVENLFQQEMITNKAGNVSAKLEKTNQK